MLVPTLPINQILQGDAVNVLETTVPDESIDLCFTSPPYLGLRTYTADDDPRELGREDLASDFVVKLANVFDVVWRKLKPTGVLMVNLGDSYNGDKNGTSNGRADQGSTIGAQKKGALESNKKVSKKKQPELHEKCKVGVHHLFWVEMVYGLLSGRKREWISRNDIPWCKIFNPMPNSGADRWNAAHEYVFVFTKSPVGYFFEKPYESSESSKKTIDSILNGETPSTVSAVYGGARKHKGYGSNLYSGKEQKFFRIIDGHAVHGAPDYWLIQPQGRSDNHFASFPDELPRRAILAACPEYVCKKCGFMRKKVYEVLTFDTRPGRNTGNGKSGSSADPNAKFHNSAASKKRQYTIRNLTGELTSCSCDAGWKPGIVLDPFCGRGTTCIQARFLARDFIGIDLDPKACELSRDNLKEFMKDGNMTGFF